MSRSKRPARWSWATGERGANRVRLYEHAVSGSLYLEWYEARPAPAEPLRRSRNLGHTDREQAKAVAYDFAARMLRGEVERQEPVVESGPLTLGTLFDNYLAERTPEKGKTSAKHDRRTAAMFLKKWGRGKPVRALSQREWDDFIRERRAGKLSKSGNPVRDRVIEQDLKFLRAVLNWGLRLKDHRGEFLLAADPLRGLKIPSESNPVRTVLLASDFDKLLEVAPSIDPRFQLALVLCAETGHRIKSVRSLRWSDVDLTAGTVHWPADFDKIDNAHETPLSDVALAALRAYRARERVLGLTWIFPGPGGHVPLERGTFYKWWTEAVEKAKITRPRGAFHTLRRRFATERLDVPLKTLAQLGGWKSTATLVECYQHPDMGALREALDAPRRKAVSG
jgi:integrase